MDIDIVKRFIYGAKEAYKKVDNHSYNFPITIESAYRLATNIETLLKEQEPRVMTLKEIISIGPEDVCGIIEVKEEEHMYGCYMRQYDEEHVEVLCDIPNLPEKLQKGCARIWTSRPTDEQRKSVKWDD